MIYDIFYLKKNKIIHQFWDFFVSLIKRKGSGTGTAYPSRAPEFIPGF
jgi:hypothetical protein